MEENGLLTLLSGQYQMQKVIETNEKTKKLGLILSEEDAKTLVERQKETLQEWQRVEFGESILPKLIFTFCDSDFIYQENYAQTIIRLQEIFYLYKNESMDELTDDELLEYMKKCFDGECQGSLELLADTSLEAFARNVRAHTRKYIGKYSMDEE